MTRYQDESFLTIILWAPWLKPFVWREGVNSWAVASNSCPHNDEIIPWDDFHKKPIKIPQHDEIFF